MYGYNSRRDGVIHVLEILVEEITELKYALEGPESYDKDLKNQLREENLWEDEVKRWNAPDENIKIWFEAKLAFAQDLYRRLEKEMEKK